MRTQVHDRNDGERYSSVAVKVPGDQIRMCNTNDNLMCSRPNR